MKILSGVDLVYLPKFKRALKNGGETFLRRVFHEDELPSNDEITHLAGIFAAKEAVTKALGLPPDSWHSIKITNSPTGAPLVKISNFKLNNLPLAEQISNYSISISHNGNYIIAQFVALLI